MNENEGATDGEQLSVSSPRRILSFKKDKRKNVTFLDGDGTGFGVFREYGPKPSEVYGFVGCITTIVATTIFLVWEYVPETWLHAIRILYSPSRYWALALSSYVIGTAFLALIFYIGLNFLSTPTSLNSLFGVLKLPSLLSFLTQNQQYPFHYAGLIILSTIPASASGM